MLGHFAFMGINIHWEGARVQQLAVLISFASSILVTLVVTILVLRRRIAQRKKSFYSQRSQA
jgi:hypothetical protein